MAQDFYKGEKKKAKKNKDKNISFSVNQGPSAPTYTMPEVIIKQKQGK